MKTPRPKPWICRLHHQPHRPTKKATPILPSLSSGWIRCGGWWRRSPETQCDPLLETKFSRRSRLPSRGPMAAQPFCTTRCLLPPARALFTPLRRNQLSQPPQKGWWNMAKGPTKSSPRGKSYHNGGMGDLLTFQGINQLGQCAYPLCTLRC